MKRLFITLTSPRLRPLLPTLTVSGLAAAWLCTTGSPVRPLHASAAAAAGPLPNRIFFPVRYDYEFDSLALLPTPLLANFTLRGDHGSDRLTAAIIRILTYETDAQVSAVDIEIDEPSTRDLMLRYNRWPPPEPLITLPPSRMILVNDIPTVVALKGGIPIGYYTLPKDFSSDDEIDWAGFKLWIESMAEK